MKIALDKRREARGRASSTGSNVTEMREIPERKSGSAGRIRTYDQPVNSRLLYH
jgi:hypothetical protein